MSQALSEQLQIYNDETFRRQTKYVVVASVMSLMPRGYVLDPEIYAGGGNSRFTWGRVHDFFERYPGSRKKQQPMHWYVEQIDKDYVTVVAGPQTNRSWWLQEQVRLGALPPSYLDSLLIVLQENFALEPLEQRLCDHMAHGLLTPLLRELNFDRQRLRYFEREADRGAVYGGDYPYLFEEPSYLNEDRLDLALKHYDKRS